VAPLPECVRANNNLHSNQEQNLLMYRSCSCLGYAASFFQPHLLQPEYYARERREFHTATAKLLTCTLLKFSALNHMTVTLLTRGLNPTSDFEARQYPHETLLLAKRVPG
jgi:hypothetical protein